MLLTWLSCMMCFGDYRERARLSCMMCFGDYRKRDRSFENLPFVLEKLPVVWMYNLSAR